MAEKSTDSNLSGTSIALGFVSLGLAFGYWLTEVYGSWTKYIAAGLILVGVVIFLIEIQNRITNKSFRFDNGGVGLLLLVPSIYFAFLINRHFTGWQRSALETIVAAFALLGCMAFIDLIVSIFEQLVKSNDLKGQIIGFLQFLALVLTSSAAVYAAVQQFINH